MILGANSNSLIPQGKLTLCCRIWQPKLKPGRCIFRNDLLEVNFGWSMQGVDFDSDSLKRSVHEQEKILLELSLYSNETEKHTHTVRVELLPDPKRWFTFINCNTSMIDGCGQVVSSNFISPISWEWDIMIYPEKCKDSNLHLNFETLIAVHVDLPRTSGGGPCSSNTLGDDFLQLYQKKTLSNFILNTEGKSFQVHKNILATRSPVFYAMFKKDQMMEQSGVVDIDDIDSETMNRLLVYLYSDSLGDLQWEEAMALYYAADKYAVLRLKQKCTKILMVGLTADNVCDALILSDKHADEQLMSCVADFIRDYKEILSSSIWENLEASHPGLTIKVFRQVFLKKTKK